MMTDCTATTMALVERARRARDRVDHSDTHRTLEQRAAIDQYARQCRAELAHHLYDVTDLSLPEAWQETARLLDD